MANDTLFPINLDIPNVKVIDINMDGYYEIFVESTKEGCNCHKCGKHITKQHGLDREIRLKHLSILEKDTYIIIRLPRYQCESCLKQPTTTQQVSWFIRRSPFTIAYEMYVLSLLIGSNAQEVSQKEGIGYASVLGIINRHVKTNVDWDKIKSLSQLGLDEISLKKGHKDFVTIVSTKVNGEIKILAILKDRKKETVKKFLSSIPKNLVKTIRSVCSDLYDGFINAAKDVFGKRVRIVADRFHVAKLYRGCLDSLRKKELKRLKQDLSKNEYDQLKGAMWVLRKNTNDLSEENKALLDKLFEYSPDLKMAYDFQNDLTSIFNMDLPRKTGKRKINSWITKVRKSNVECYDKFLSTLESYMTEIVNYFVHRDSSGFVEGLNNKIKVIKRRCYGILNVDHLFQRIFLDLSGRKVFSL